MMIRKQRVRFYAIRAIEVLIEKKVKVCVRS